MQYRVLRLLFRAGVCFTARKHLSYAIPVYRGFADSFGARSRPQARKQVAPAGSAVDVGNGYALDYLSGALLIARVSAQSGGAPKCSFKAKQSRAEFPNRAPWARTRALGKAPSHPHKSTRL